MYVIYSIYIDLWLNKALSKAWNESLNLTWIFLHQNIFISKKLSFVQRNIALIYTVDYSKPQHLAVVP